MALQCQQASKLQILFPIQAVVSILANILIFNERYTALEYSEIIFVICIYIALGIYVFFSNRKSPKDGEITNLQETTN